MHQRTVRIAEQLYFDVTRAAHQFLQVHFIVAEGRLGLTACNRQQFRQRRLVVDDAHATPATAPTRLEHHWIAHLGRQLRALLEVCGERRCGWHNRHASGHRQIARRDFVTERAHGRRRGSNEDHAGACAGCGEFRTLREKPVPGMNRVGFGLQRCGDDLLDIEVGL